MTTSTASYDASVAASRSDLRVVVACERVPLTSPTGSTISVTIDQSTLPLNGQATVRAIVTESAGTPVHNGTEVTFASIARQLRSADGDDRERRRDVDILRRQHVSGTTRINAYSGGAAPAPATAAAAARSEDRRGGRR